ncbi:hypothetical protein ACIA5C_15295 [Actinoplanes sp. NPDC051343]|uniref:hypothetical protein n=1 Tax=Actinoplanes sp. NPDC051343 TaxID=3363906 RepID=UPI0037A5C0F1
MQLHDSMLRDGHGSARRESRRVSRRPATARTMQPAVAPTPPGGGSAVGDGQDAYA